MFMNPEYQFLKSKLTELKLAVGKNIEKLSFNLDR